MMKNRMYEAAAADAITITPQPALTAAAAENVIARYRRSVDAFDRRELRRPGRMKGTAAAPQSMNERKRDSSRDERIKAEAA